MNIATFDEIVDNSLNSLSVFSSDEMLSAPFAIFSESDGQTAIISAFSNNNEFAYAPLRSFFSILRFNDNLMTRERYIAFNQVFWRFALVGNAVLDETLLAHVDRISGVRNNLGILLRNGPQRLYFARAPAGEAGKAAYAALFAVLVKILFKHLLLRIASLSVETVSLIFGRYDVIRDDTPFAGLLDGSAFRVFDFRHRAELDPLKVRDSYRLVPLARLLDEEVYTAEDLLMKLAIKMNNVLLIARMRLSAAYMMRHVNSGLVRRVFEMLLKMEMSQWLSNFNVYMNLLEYLRNTIVLMNAVNGDSSVPRDVIVLRKSDFVERFYPDYLAAEHFFFHLLDTGERYFVSYGVTDFFLSDDHRDMMVDTKINDGVWYITVDMLHHCRQLNGEDSGRTFYDGWVDMHLLYSQNYLNVLDSIVHTPKVTRDMLPAQMRVIQKRLAYYDKHDPAVLIGDRNEAELLQKERSLLVKSLNRIYKGDVLDEAKFYGDKFEAPFSSAPRYFEMWAQTLYRYVNNNPITSREFRIVAQHCEFIEATTFTKIGANEPFLHRLFSYYPGYLVVYYNDALAAKKHLDFAFDTCLSFLRRRVEELAPDLLGVVQDLSALRQSDVHFFATGGVFMRDTLKRLSESPSLASKKLNKMVETQIAKRGVQNTSDERYKVLNILSNKQSMRQQIFVEAMSDGAFDGKVFPPVLVQWLVRVHAYAHHAINAPGKLFRFRSREDECVFSIMNFYMARRLRRPNGKRENFAAFVVRNNLQMMFNPSSVNLDASYSLNYPNNDYNPTPYFEWMLWHFEQKPTVLPILTLYKTEWIANYLYEKPTFVPTYARAPAKKVDAEQEAAEAADVLNERAPSTRVVNPLMSRNVILELYKKTQQMSLYEIFYRHVPSAIGQAIVDEDFQKISYILILMYGYPNATAAAAAIVQGGVPDLSRLDARERDVLFIIQHVEKLIEQKFANLVRSQKEKGGAIDPTHFTSALIIRLRNEYKQALSWASGGNTLRDASLPVAGVLATWKNDLSIASTVISINEVYASNVLKLRTTLVDSMQKMFLQNYGTSVTVRSRIRNAMNSNHYLFFLDAINRRIKEWANDRNVTPDDSVRFRRVLRILNIMYYIIAAVLSVRLGLAKSSQSAWERNITRSENVVRELQQKKSGERGESDALRNVLNRMKNAMRHRDYAGMADVTIYLSLSDMRMFMPVLRNASEMFVPGVFDGFEPLFFSVMSGDEAIEQVPYPTFSGRLKHRSLMRGAFFMPVGEEGGEGDLEEDDEAPNAAFINMAENVTSGDALLMSAVAQSQAVSVIANYEQGAYDEEEQEEEEQPEPENYNDVRNVLMHAGENPFDGQSQDNFLPPVIDMNAQSTTFEVNPFSQPEPYPFDFGFSSSQADPTGFMNVNAHFDERVTAVQRAHLVAKIGAPLCDVNGGVRSPSLFVLPYHDDWYNRMPKTTRAVYHAHPDVPVLLLASEMVAAPRLARDLVTFRVPTVVCL